MIYPNWKIRLAEKHLKDKTVPPNEGDVKNLYLGIKNECPNPRANELIQECYHIYKDSGFCKEVLEGCFLCEDATLADIQIITGMPLDLIEVYNIFFFDTRTFRYRLQRYDYVRTYRNRDFPEAQLYKRWAVSVGINFFRWHFGRNKNLMPKELLMDLVGDTFMRSKEHLNESLTSETSQQALKWIKQATDTISAYSKIEEENITDMRNQVRIALEYHDTTKAGDDISDAEIIS